MDFKLLFLIVVYYNDFIEAQSAANLIVENYYSCKDVPVPNEKANLTLVPKTFTSPQILDIFYRSSIPVGNQIRLSLDIDIENKLLASHWQHLLTIADDFCRFMHLYMGPFVHDLETAMGMQTGVCPFPKGNYHAINFTADFNRMKLQGLPFGKLRSTAKLYEKPGNNLVMCKVSILSNRH